MKFKKLLDAKLLFAIAAALTALRTIYIILKVNIRGDTGVTCACLHALRLNINPYFVENLKQFDSTGLSCTYHAISYYFLTPACAVKDYSLPLTVLGFSAAVSILGIFLNRHYWRLFLLSYLGLFAGHFVYYETGNIMTLLEVLAFCLFFFFVEKKRFGFAGATLGFAIFLKLTPVIYFPGFLYLLWKEQDKSKLKYFFLTTSAVFIVLFATNALMFSDTILDYYKGLLGLIPHQHTPMGEMSSGGSNPTYILFLKDLFKLYGIGGDGGKALALLLGGVSFYFLLKKWKWGTGLLSDMAFLFAAMSLVSPRTKPYYYLVIAVGFFYLLKSKGRLGTQLLSAGVILSVAGSYFFGLQDQFGSFWQIATSNYQLMICLLFLIVLVRWQPQLLTSSEREANTR